MRSVVRAGPLLKSRPENVAFARACRHRGSLMRKLSKTPAEDLPRIKAAGCGLGEPAPFEAMRRVG